MTVEKKNYFICDTPCHYGGLSAARKYSRSEFGKIWHCNRRVKSAGERCYQHKGYKQEN